MSGNAQLTLYTIGHSTRSLAEFIGLLKDNGVNMVVDVRTIPRSRHNPQFNMDTLPQALHEAGMTYRHMTGLGGLRHPHPGSVNTGWRNKGFRAYADYMQTPEFEASLQELIALSEKNTIALMCAEAVPWRCHRSLIADALTARGIKVIEIITKNSVRPHKLTSWGKIEDGRLFYPAATND